MADIKLMIAVGLTATLPVLALLGRKEQKKTQREVRLDKKEFPLRSVLAVGYGIGRLLPLTRWFEWSKPRRIYQDRFKNREMAKRFWAAFVSQLSTMALLSVVISSWLVYVVTQKAMGDKAYLLIALTVTFFALATVSMYQRVVKSQKERLDQIRDELPNVVNNITILHNSGMPMASVLVRMGQHPSNDNPIYEELRKVEIELSNNVPILEALGRMRQRCRCMEVNRLYTIIEQNINRGTDDCDIALATFATELWQGRCERQKRRGIQKGQLLIIPTMALFIVAIILTGFPAMASLGGFSGSSESTEMEVMHYVNETEITPVPTQATKENNSRQPLGE